MVSPVVFTYRVIQCKNILDPTNDTLLWGHLGEEELKHTLSNCKPPKRFVVIDENVNKLYGSQVSQYFKARGVVYKILPLPTTEENKCMELVTKILEEVHEFGIDRRSEPIVAIGGGVCLDVVGLAASLYRVYSSADHSTFLYRRKCRGKNRSQLCWREKQAGKLCPTSGSLLRLLILPNSPTTSDL